MTTPEAIAEALAAIEEEAGNLWHFMEMEEAKIPKDLYHSLDSKVRLIWDIAKHSYDIRTPQDKGES